MRAGDLGIAPHAGADFPYLSSPRLPFFQDPGKPADTKVIRTALEQARNKP
jgi:hypothetical protein